MGSEIETAPQRGRPQGMFLSAGQVSDYTGAVALLRRSRARILHAKVLLADWSLHPQFIKQKIQIPHVRLRYRNRHNIETILGKTKDCGRIDTGYVCCALAFL